MPEELSEVPIEQIEEKEIKIEPPLDERAEAFRPTLHRMFEIMQENNIYAVKAFGPKQVFELANADPQVEEELERQMLEHYKYGSSGFFIFEGAHPDLRTVLFKLKLDNVESSRKTFHNELYFYKDLMPFLKDYIADKKIKIPKLLEGGFSKEGHSFIVTEFAEGEVLGDIRDAKTPLPIEEFQEVIEFVDFFQKTLTPEKVSEISPNIDQNDKGVSCSYDHYFRQLQRYQDKWQEHFSPEELDKMEKFLTDNEELIRNSPKTFSNLDINPANIIKSEDGTFTLIDWERLKTVPNNADAYNHIIEGHWRFPELQREMVKRVLDLNKDDPNFKTLFKAEMIFYKYSCHYFSQLKDPNISEEERKNAQEGLNAVVSFIKEALDEKGAWKEEIKGE